MKKDNLLKRLLKDEAGVMGVKEIAATVAVIVIIGLAITAIQGNLPSWIDEIWNIFVREIEELVD